MKPLPTASKLPYFFDRPDMIGSKAIAPFNDTDHRPSIIGSRAIVGA
jgi:hypothetical protein